MDPIDLLPARIRALKALQGSHDVDGFQLAADGCEVLFVAAREGTELPPHSHDTENLSVILTGELVMHEAGEAHRFAPGEWYRTAPGSEHALRFTADTVQLEFRFDADVAPSRHAREGPAAGKAG